MDEVRQISNKLLNEVTIHSFEPFYLMIYSEKSALNTRNISAKTEAT
jgi:hypothetical protein